MKTNLNGIQKGLFIMINIKDLPKAQVLHAFRCLASLSEKEGDE